MPRKTKEQTELTRRRILDVALDVFAEKGYSRTSLQEIAARAGFTRGAVYWHFKNKADLFMALAEDVEGDSADAFGDVGRLQSREDLKRALCDYLGRFETDERFGTFHRLLEYRTEWVEELTPLLERSRSELRELAQWLVAAVRRLAALGEVEASRDAKKDGLALYIHFMGLYAIWMTDPGLLSMTEDAPEQINRFLEGLQARASA